MHLLKVKFWAAIMQMYNILALLALVLLAPVARARDAPADLVAALPTYGPLKTKQYAGFADATPDGKNRLFYWFCESDVGSTNASVPLLVWFNGGPGASSITGLLAENLGPQSIAANGTLVDNPHRVTLVATLTLASALALTPP